MVVGLQAVAIFDSNPEELLDDPKFECNLLG